MGGHEPEEFAGIQQNPHLPSNVCNTFSGSGALKSSGTVNWPLAKPMGRGWESGGGFRMVSRPDAPRRREAERAWNRRPRARGIRQDPTESSFALKRLQHVFRQRGVEVIRHSELALGQTDGTRLGKWRWIQNGEQAGRTAEARAGEGLEWAATSQRNSQVSNRILICPQTSATRLPAAGR